MGPDVTGTQARRAQGDTVARLADSSWRIVVAAAIGGAWLIAVFAQLMGNARALHHHALIEGGLPLWVALLLFLIAWQVMIAAMMLPASLPAVQVFAAQSGRLSRPALAMVAFLVAYAFVWTAVGLAAFLGDVALHNFADATPFLGTRPWLIEVGVLALAGAYQFVPLKHRALAACRHPAGQIGGGKGTVVRVSRHGFRHALDCVACSWALMLLMFAAGFANLWWMAALAVLMAYETMGRHGQRAAVAAGGVLLALAGLVVVTGWAPAFGAA